MKALRVAIVSLLLVLAGAGVSSADGFHHGGGWGRGGGSWSHPGYRPGGWGHGGHDRVHFGFFLGFPFAPLWGPTYVAPSRVIVAQPPPVYYAAPPAGPQYWYYCSSSRTYYPYVSSCPEGWMQVVPQAPGAGASPPR